MKKYTLFSIIGCLLLVILVPAVSSNVLIIKGVIIDLLLYAALAVCICYFIRFHLQNRSQKIYVIVEDSQLNKTDDTKTAENEVNLAMPIPSLESSVKEKITAIEDVKRHQVERRALMDINYLDVKMATPDQKLLDRVANTIRENIGNPDFGVEELSAYMGMSRVHLNRKLKELIDTTPSTLIKTTRLKQSLQMLIEPNVSVADVAYAVGFSTSAYFALSFQQYYGLSPKEFVVACRRNPESDLVKKLLNEHV